MVPAMGAVDSKKNTQCLHRPISHLLLICDLVFQTAVVVYCACCVVGDCGLRAGSFRRAEGETNKRGP